MKLPILFFCVTYVLLTLCTSSEAEELHPAEVSALRDLMANIQGWPPAWQPATAEMACGDGVTGVWPGLSCISLDGYLRVRRLEKTLFNSTQLLVGTIPESIANLTKVTVIDLTSQALSGTVPAGLFTLPVLGFVSLSNNFFTGNLPTELGPLLSRIFMRENFLEGTLPDAMLSPKLTELRLDGNQLECPLPLEYVVKLLETHPDEGTPECDISGNRFFMQDGKICGTIPKGKYNCTIVPQKDDINAGMTDSIQAVAESTAIRLQARGAAIEIIPLLSAGNTYGEGHLVFKVESILQDGYFTALKSFGSSFNKTGDSTWTITAEFTDGTPMLLDFTLTTQEGEPYLKFGWTITSHNLPSSTRNFHILIKLFAKMQLSTTELYGCETTNVMDAFELAVATGATELVLSNCLGTVANVSSRFRFARTRTLCPYRLLDDLSNTIIDAGFLKKKPPEGAYATFEVRSPTLAVSQGWSNVAFVDGAIRLLDIRSALLYQKEGLLTTASLGRARRLGVAHPIIAPAPANEQFLGVLLDLQFPPFSESIVYDPDIRFDYLFAMEEEVANYGWIAAVVVGAAIVIAVFVVVLSPKARAALLPFTTRSKDHKQRLTSLESNDNIADTKESGWVTRNPTAVELRNT